MVSLTVVSGFSFANSEETNFPVLALLDFLTFFMAVKFDDTILLTANAIIKDKKNAYRIGKRFQNAGYLLFSKKTVTGYLLCRIALG